jgi:hypothetical protein
MTSSFGTDTGFSSISDNYLYLNLNDNDKIYNYDITVGQLRKNRVPEQLYENQSILANLTMDNYNSYRSLIEHTELTPNSSIPTTVYDILSLYPELTECKKLVDSCGYNKELSYVDSPRKYLTFFAFTNENAGLANIWLKRFNTLGYQREFLKAHTTDFTADPILFKGRKVKINTRSLGNELYANGQTNPMYFYSDAKDFNLLTYSPPMIKVNILGFITTQNGALYIIDRPFYPQIIL